MDLTPTREQRDLRDEARRLFTRLCTPELVRAWRSPDATKPPDELWSQLAGFGAFGVALPTDVGGGDGTVFELGLLHQEAGRALCPTPYYTSTVAALLIDRLGADEQRSAWLPGLADGSSVGAHAVWDPSGAEPPALPTATRVDAGWLVTGTADYVGNGDIAAVLVAAARSSDDGRSVVFVVPAPNTLPMARHRTFSHDIQCRIGFEEVVIPDGDVLMEVTTPAHEEQLDLLRNTVLSLGCMEMVGGAEAVLDRTAAYVCGREQFGRPIGSFQAVQHHVANMRIAIEGARLAALQAMWWVGEGRAAAREVAIAKARSGDAYKSASLLAHQLHGGMGYMRETDLHLWSERAKTAELQFGAWDVQLERIASTLGLADD